MSVRELYRCPIYFWIDRQAPWPARTPWTSRTWRGRDIAIPGEGFKCLERLRAAAERHGVTLGRIFEMSEIFQLYEFAASGRGLGFTVRHLVQLPTFSRLDSVVAVPIRAVRWGFGIECVATHALGESERTFWGLVRLLRAPAAERLARGPVRAVRMTSCHEACDEIRHLRSRRPTMTGVPCGACWRISSMCHARSSGGRRGAAGGLLVDGTAARSTQPVRAGPAGGDRRGRHPARPRRGACRSSHRRGRSRSLYEDEDLIAVNKPADQVVHPCPGHRSGTLGNFVMGHLYAQGSGCARLYPVHRLDLGTSGLLLLREERLRPPARPGVAARADDCTGRRAGACGARRRGGACGGSDEGGAGTRREDVARPAVPPGPQLAGGCTSRCARGGPIARTAWSTHPSCARATSPSDAWWTSAASAPSRTTACSPSLRARTGRVVPMVVTTGAMPVSPAVRGEGLSLILVRLETGRTHQIRVHMAHIGHPACR